MRTGLIDDGLIDHRGVPARVVFVARVARAIDYLFGALYTLLGVRFALDFFSARTDTGFYQLIGRLTDVFYAPFRGIFATTTVDGGRVVWPLVVAILAYMVLHAAVRGLLRLIARA